MQAQHTADSRLSNVQQAGNLLVRQALFVEGAHDGLPQLLGGGKSDLHPP
jgi:hypothetical protein